ncbi:Transcription initiation factor TFIID subunit 8 [Ananas comosus]|uniref:Transcription initiation factor TFIID subunit 8 n=1 Tax=Ananas comosus TaxID=4615 RepID=A0A199V5F8_ANACO|nr:Transcription initiation factor TFIID subunit 8 [Ananas comosus]
MEEAAVELDALHRLMKQHLALRSSLKEGARPLAKPLTINDNDTIGERSPSPKSAAAPGSPPRSPAPSALSDVAALYIEALARSAAGHANDRGRTDSNLLDLVRALEELEAAACGGFLGGSDPPRLLLRSSKLTELMAFVRDADEVPFAKPIRRRAGKGGERRRAPPSFVEAGKEPPMPHVPRWLPCFPESWEGWGRRGEKEMAAKEEKEEEMAVGMGMDGVVKREESGVAGVLPEERARVRFRIGAGSDRRRRGR